MKGPAIIAHVAFVITASVTVGQDTDPFGPPPDQTWPSPPPGFLAPPPTDEFDPFGPFSPPEPAPFDPEVDDPKMIRVLLEFIELSHRDCTAIMAEPVVTNHATPQRIKIASMEESNRARVVETMMLTTPSGNRNRASSKQEMTYPSEYDPEQPPTADAEKPPEWHRWKQNLALLRIPTAHTIFETRDCGSVFEAQAFLSADKASVVMLNLSARMTRLAGFVVHSEFTTRRGGLHQDKQPRFVSEQFRASVFCSNGEYQLVSILSPMDDEGNAVRDRKLMVFVKCDVMAVSESE